MFFSYFLIINHKSQQTIAVAEVIIFVDNLILKQQYFSTEINHILYLI